MVSTDPNDPNFGLETDQTNPNFGLPAAAPIVQPSQTEPSQSRESARPTVSLPSLTDAIFGGGGEFVRGAQEEAGKLIPRTWGEAGNLVTGATMPFLEAPTAIRGAVGAIEGEPQDLGPLKQLEDIKAQYGGGSPQYQEAAGRAAGQILPQIAMLALPKLTESIFGKEKVPPVQETATLPEAPVISEQAAAEVKPKEVIPSAIKEGKIQESVSAERPRDDTSGTPTETSGSGGIQPTAEVAGQETVAPTVPQLEQPISDTGNKLVLAIDPNKLQVRVRSGGDLSSPIEIKDVQGTKVKLDEAPNHDFFVYKSDAKTDKPWHLVEKSTGLALNETATKAEAINKAREQISSRGLDEFEKDINYAKTKDSIFTTPQEAPSVSEGGKSSVESVQPREVTAEPQPPAATAAEKPPSQTGISTERFKEQYGDQAPVSVGGRGPAEWKQIGQSRLDNFQKIGSTSDDPYTVLTNLREGKTPVSQMASDVSLLRAEHQRLIEDARSSEGTPDYAQKSAAAQDMAQAIKEVAHGPSSDVFRSLQEYDQPRYDNLTDFDQAIRERMGRESTPDEQSQFQRIVNDRVKTRDIATKEVDVAQQQVQKYRGKEKMSFDDAAKSIHDQIEKLTKDCV